MSLDEAFQELYKDMQYYRDSGGGVTVSGGEPLYQPEFVATLLKQCRDAGIHTCVETCGYSDGSALEKILPYVDLILFDLKHMDPIAHRKLTMCSNEPIIRNLELIVARGTPVIIRVPLITGLNDSDEDVTAIARTIGNMKHLNEVNLLPYHKFGMGKYKMLDRRYKLSKLVRPTELKLQRVKEIFESFGIDCKTIN